MKTYKVKVYKPEDGMDCERTLCANCWFTKYKGGKCPYVHS